MLEILRERGLEHEQAYVQRLRAVGKRVTCFVAKPKDASTERPPAPAEAIEEAAQAEDEPVPGPSGGPESGAPDE